MEHERRLEEKAESKAGLPNGNICDEAVLAALLGVK